MNKVALFDFCETLANFQTADPFVDYVREHRSSKRMIWLERIKAWHDRCRLLGIIEYLLFPKSSISKRLKLLQLKGFKESELVKYAQGYYTEVVKPNLIEVIVDELLHLKSDHQIYLVSGGYDLYLNFFVEDFGLDGCLSSKIQFKDNICTGKLEGKDCMYQNKVKFLNHYFIKKPDYVIAYSDSKTDIPLLDWADEGIVISKEKSQKWAADYNYKEILW